MSNGRRSYLTVHLIHERDTTVDVSPKRVQSSFLLPYFSDVTTWEHLHAGIEYRLNQFYVEHAVQKTDSESSSKSHRQLQALRATAAAERKRIVQERLPENARMQYLVACAGGSSDPADHMCRVCDHPPCTQQQQEVHSCTKKRITVFALKKESPPKPFRSLVQTRRGAAAGTGPAQKASAASDGDIIPRSAKKVSESELETIYCFFDLEVVVALDDPPGAAGAPTSRAETPKDHADWHVSDCVHNIDIVVGNGQRHFRRPVQAHVTVGEFAQEIAQILGASGIRCFYQKSSKLFVFFSERIGNIVGFTNFWHVEVVPDGKGLLNVSHEDRNTKQMAARHTTEKLIYLDSPAETPAMSDHRKEAARRIELSVPSTVNTYRVVSSRATSNATHSIGFGTREWGSHHFGGGRAWLHSDDDDDDGTGSTATHGGQKRSRTGKSLVSEDDSDADRDRQSDGIQSNSSSTGGWLTSSMIRRHPPPPPMKTISSLLTASDSHDPLAHHVNGGATSSPTSCERDQRSPQQLREGNQISYADVLIFDYNDSEKDEIWGDNDNDRGNEEEEEEEAEETDVGDDDECGGAALGWQSSSGSGDEHSVGVESA